jgi:hypothetical protein
MQVKVMLRAGLTARRASASGRKGATRWEIYDGPDADYDKWLGDIVRFMPEGVWQWQPRSGDVIEDRDPYAVARKAGLK